MSINSWYNTRVESIRYDTIYVFADKKRAHTKNRIWRIRLAYEEKNDNRFFVHSNWLFILYERTNERTERTNERFRRTEWTELTNEPANECAKLKKCWFCSLWCVSEWVDGKRREREKMAIIRYLHIVAVCTSQHVAFASLILNGVCSSVLH